MKGKNIKKLTLKYVKKEALKLGHWKIIADIYGGSGVKLKCECLKCGVYNKMSWDNIKQNKGCSNCNRLAYMPKMSIQEVRKSFEKEGYTLLTKIYKNNRQKLKYRCGREHIHNVTWGNWNSNERRCPYCYGNAKLNLEYIKSLFGKEGYVVIGEYKNNYTPIEYRCPIGHEHSVRVWDWKNGDRCPYCSSGEVKRKLTTEIVRAELAEEGYTLLSEYENSRTKFLYECKKNHRHTMTYRSWYQGCRCPFCNNTGVSKWEKVVKNFLDKSNIDYVSNDRTQLVNPETGYNLELDIWMPKSNKAIECNGVYWHSKPDRKEHDKIKKQLCKKQGIDLLVITDEDWTSTQERCQINILLFLENK